MYVFSITKVLHNFTFSNMFLRLIVFICKDISLRKYFDLTFAYDTQPHKNHFSVAFKSITLVLYLEL